MREIPAFGIYKLYNVAQPFLAMALPSIFGPKAAGTADANANPNPNAEPELSRKQQKLKARMDKGDKRIQQIAQKR